MVCGIATLCVIARTASVAKRDVATQYYPKKNYLCQNKTIIEMKIVFLEPLGLKTSIIE